jgi:RNA polymerase sigma-70 factor, ECF subfamily
VTTDELSELALRAARSDRVALSDLVRATQADVWRLCAHLVDRDSADDLTQEAYARAIAALPRFRGESAVRLWLIGIARHVCVDEVRRRGRRRRIVGQAPPPAVVTPDPTGAVDLDALLGELDPDQRAAFVATQVLGLRYAEAAQALGCPVGTIRSRVARAREALITALDTGSGYSCSRSDANTSTRNG